MYRVKRKIPKGYVLKYTDSGQPFLERLVIRNTMFHFKMICSTHKESVSDYMAATEHNRNAIRTSATKKQIGERFGIGIYLYFDFIRYITFTNLVLFVLGMSLLYFNYFNLSFISIN